ncbi:hypothetical protein [Acidianus manzaensis]|uniref:Uncharacterized protein n=1 Tax=Acidianus manzaensis TaxID=282676 RepID=A0A1W6K088_9CREN|nr:hypothetical protein [Acidianus manzaensis]ARM75880.1 hypothetical protein B6F84_07435 [Acidianus manzaensis]
MINILKVVFNENLKKQIKFDGHCITQIVKNLPSNAVLRQACYIFFQTYRKSKIKDPTLYFLSLLYSDFQISKVIEYNKLNEGDNVYIITCCNEVTSRDVISILSNNERLMLTRNAINSAF